MIINKSLMEFLLIFDTGNDMFIVEGFLRNAEVASYSNILQTYYLFSLQPLYHLI